MLKGKLQVVCSTPDVGIYQRSVVNIDDQFSRKLELFHYKGRDIIQSHSEKK